MQKTLFILCSFLFVFTVALSSDTTYAEGDKKKSQTTQVQPSQTTNTTKKANDSNSDDEDISPYALLALVDFCLIQ